MTTLAIAYSISVPGKAAACCCRGISLHSIVDRQLKVDSVLASGRPTTIMNIVAGTGIILSIPVERSTGCCRGIDPGSTVYGQVKSDGISTTLGVGEGVVVLTTLVIAHAIAVPGKAAAC